ncbi:MAG: DUF115 domain-containing protein [Lachnospiraceae bacterium]|nr:DUF115 domain-containing protein [Lachnospiraceae bacterium]
MDLTELCDRVITDIDGLAACCLEQKKEEALQKTGALMGRLATFLDLVFKTSSGAASGFERETEILKSETIPAIASVFEAIKTGDVEVLGNTFNDKIKDSLQAFGHKASETGRRMCFEIPETDASEWVKNFKEVSSRTVIMFGGSDGKLIRKLLGILDGKSRIIVCEPLKNDYAALTECLSDERLITVDFSEDSPAFSDELIKRVDYYSIARMDVCVHPAYDSAFPREYEMFLRMVNDNRERLLVNMNTMTRFRDEGTLHILENIKAIGKAYFVSELKKTDVSDTTAIIVSAGPSLDKNIEELRAAKGRALIIAVDTALKYMLARDIVPDIFVTIDPDKPMENFTDERVRDIPVIFDEQTPSALLREHKAAKVLYNCRDYPKRLFEECGVSVDGNIASGGSVATAAFAICCDLGIKNIILIGQDLAYTGEITHAGGVVSAGVNGDIGTVMIEGIDGQKVRTRSDWLGYLRWFERTIEAVRQEKPSIHVIDATEGGALIRGTEVMTLKEAIAETIGNDAESDNDEGQNCKDGTQDCEQGGKHDSVKAGKPGEKGNSLLPGMLAKISPALDDEGRKKFVELHKREVASLPKLKADAEEGLSLSEEIGNRIKEILAKQYKSGTTGAGVISKEVKELVAEMGKIRKRCESRLIFPVINNYAVTYEADEIGRILCEKASANGETAKFFFDIEASKVAFRGVASACEFLMKNYPRKRKKSEKVGKDLSKRQ